MYVAIVSSVDCESSARGGSLLLAAHGPGTGSVPLVENWAPVKDLVG